MTVNEISLRLAQETDAWVLSAIHIAAIKALPPNFYSKKQLLAWRNYLHKPNGKRILNSMQIETFWVAIDNDMIAGFASFIVEELISLYVHPYYQGQGIGRTLVKHFCHEASEQGVDQVITNASLYAEGFYVRMGFTGIKRVPHQLSTGIFVPVTKMSKKLSIPTY